MKIAVYGGSFNPPHLGHVAAAKALTENIHPDRFLVMPDNTPPHKQLAENSPSPEERFHLCELAFADVPGCEICDMELQRSGRSYTSDTVAQLLELYPGDELSIAIGTDMLMTFESWNKADYIMANAGLIVLARNYGDTEALEEQAEYLRGKYGARITIVYSEPIPMSSSIIRSLLKKRLGRDMLPEKVYGEIIRKRFYAAKPEFAWLREQSYAHLKPNRVSHVAGCEQEAIRLAERWGEDPEKAAEAGILHDITKKLTYEEQLKLCEKYDIINDNAELENLKLLHAKTGAALSKDLFGIQEDIYSAIRWHTTGKPEMTLLEKIVYMADYIEPNRDFPGVEELRRLAYEDLDAAMALGLEMSLEDIRSYGTEPYKDSVDACNWYTNLIKGEKIC